MQTHNNAQSMTRSFRVEYTKQLTVSSSMEYMNRTYLERLFSYLVNEKLAAKAAENSQTIMVESSKGQG